MPLYIMRHAESYSNIQGRIMSTTDLPLTEKGEKQAEAAREYLHRLMGKGYFDLVFNSTLLRAKQTAQIVNGGGDGIIESSHLKEMDLGRLEKLSWEEKERMYPGIDIAGSLAYTVCPGGESFADLYERCGLFISEYAGLFKGNTLIVTHGITLRALVNRLLGRPACHVNHFNWCDNASFTEVEYDAAKKTGRLARLNERRHLDEHGLGTPGHEKWAFFSKLEYENLYSQRETPL